MEYGSYIPRDPKNGARFLSDAQTKAFDEWLMQVRPLSFRV